MTMPAAAGAHPLEPQVGQRLVTGRFFVVTLAVAVYFLAVGMQNPILSVFIEDELAGGGTEIGAQAAVFSISAILIRPVIGALGDRRGRRFLMVSGALVSTGSVAGLAVTDHLVSLLVFRALTGIGEAAIFVGGATLIADLSPPNRRAEGASYFSVAVFSGLGIGPIIGEAILGDGRYARTFSSAALVCATAAVIAWSGPRRDVPVGSPVDDQNLARPGEVEGSWIRRMVHPAAVAPGLVLACGIASVVTFFVFVPTYVDQVGLSGSALVFLLYSTISLVLRIVLAKVPERIGLGRAATWALSLLVIGGMVTVIRPSSLALYAGTVVLSVGNALLYPSLMAAAVRAVSERERARVLAGFTMFFEVGAAAGGLALGPLVAATDERAAFLGGAVFAAVGLAVLRRITLPMLERRAEPATSAPSPPESQRTDAPEPKRSAGDAPAS